MPKHQLYITLLLGSCFINKTLASETSEFVTSGNAPSRSSSSSSVNNADWVSVVSEEDTQIMWNRFDIQKSMYDGRDFINKAMQTFRSGNINKSIYYIKEGQAKLQGLSKDTLNEVQKTLQSEKDYSPEVAVCAFATLLYGDLTSQEKEEQYEGSSPLDQVMMGLSQALKSNDPLDGLTHLHKMGDEFVRSRQWQNLILLMGRALIQSAEKHVLANPLTPLTKSQTQIIKAFTPDFLKRLTVSKGTHYLQDAKNNAAQENYPEAINQILHAARTFKEIPANERMNVYLSLKLDTTLRDHALLAFAYIFYGEKMSHEERSQELKNPSLTRRQKTMLHIAQATDPRNLSAPFMALQHLHEALLINPDNPFWRNALTCLGQNAILAAKNRLNQTNVELRDSQKEAVKAFMGQGYFSGQRGKAYLKRVGRGSHIGADQFINIEHATKAFMEIPTEEQTPLYRTLMQEAGEEVTLCAFANVFYGGMSYEQRNAELSNPNLSSTRRAMVHIAQATDPRHIEETPLVALNHLHQALCCLSVNNGFWQSALTYMGSKVIDAAQTLMENPNVEFDDQQLKAVKVFMNNQYVEFLDNLELHEIDQGLLDNILKQDTPHLEKSLKSLVALHELAQAALSDKMWIDIVAAKGKSLIKTVAKQLEEASNLTGLGKAQEAAVQAFLGSDLLRKIAEIRNKVRASFAAEKARDWAIDWRS